VRYIMTPASTTAADITAQRPFYTQYGQPNAEFGIAPATRSSTAYSAFAGHLVSL